MSDVDVREADRELLARRVTARGALGVIAATAPAAAAVGASMLLRGGNAFDAAVAAALAETVLLPPKCGMAGDLVALVQRETGGPLRALIALGPAPGRLADAVAGRGLPVTGGLSVGVPGAPAGYAELSELGRLGRAEHAAAAIRLAREGFVWSPLSTELTEEARDLLLAENPEGCPFLPGGEPIGPGDVVRLPGLVRVLEGFAERGRAVFRGELGEAVVGAVAARGGVLELEDLRGAEAEWCEPVGSELNGLRLSVTPAPTHGPSLLSAVADPRLGGGVGEAWDAVHDAIRARSGTLADPRPPGGTSMVGAADAEGNAVVLLHSNSYPQFGSGIVVPGLDLVLSNRAGRGFADRPGHPNAPAPGRRPALTLHLWAVDGPRGRLLGGTPGGDNQMPWNAQALREVLRGEDRPGHLVTSPRWGRTPDGEGVRVEEGFDRDEVAELGTKVAAVERVPRFGLRSAQQVLGPLRQGQALEAAADPRSGGLAVGV